MKELGSDAPQDRSFRPRLFRSLARIGAIVAGAVLILSSCGNNNGSPTDPGGSTSAGPTLDASCPSSPSPLSCAPTSTLGMQIRAQAFDSPATPASFTYTLGDQTVSGTGTLYSQFVGFTAGTFTISGQVQASDIVLALIQPPTSAKGGVLGGSIVSLNGPLAGGQNPAACSIHYTRSAGTSGAVTFKFQFMITSTFNAATACF